MMHLSFVRALRHTGSTLKFKIVALTAFTAIAAAMGAVQIALDATVMDFEQSVVVGEAADAERTATLLGDKLGMLQTTLRAVARATPAGLWSDPSAMAPFITDHAALHALFDVVLAVDAAGDQLTRQEKGVPTGRLANLAREESFIRALGGDQPVVSHPLISQVLKVPVVALLQPAVDEAGRQRGVLIGTLRLQSAELFSLTARDTGRGTREIVIDRRGTVLSHPDPLQIMHPVGESAGMGAIVSDWLDRGAPIDTRAAVQRNDGYFVALAGIPGSDWALVRITDEQTALRAVELARQRGWKISAVAGVLSGILAGVLVWFAALPITRLREEVERLTANPQQRADWPREGGEIGRLAAAFGRLIAARDRQERRSDALMREMQAIMDHAQVGIALSKDKVFQRANAKLGHMLGIPASNVVGQTPRYLHSCDESYQASCAAVTTGLRLHGAYQGERELIRCNGERFWCEIHATAVDTLDLSAGVIWTFRDVQQDKEQRDQLAWAAGHDALTGLANRSGFDAALAQACGAPSPSFSALFIDLDRFKLVNDTGGHDAGDAMLQAIAEVISGCVRQTDLVARLGGDEFAVLLNDCPAERAAIVGDKILRSVELHKLAWEGHAYRVGASIGLVTACGADATPSRILKAADTACYAAKRGGRNCLVAADWEHSAPLPA